MARKKNTRTRRQEFKSRRRNSWLGFLTKVTLFVAPVIGVTVWLVLLLLGRGQAVPILTLNFNSAPNTKAGDTWDRINYDLNKISGIKLPEFKYGGPNRDVVVVFNDLLGSAKPDGENGSLAACIFEPSNSTEHLTHAFRGLCSNDTTAEKEQWIRFEDYIKKTVDAISQTAKGLSSERGKILFVLDIDHPDVPARLPPQADQFIRLCKSQWESKSEELNLTHDVYVWLSHSEGEKSYYDSDYVKVESFFKLRFDQAVSGDVLTLKDREEPGGKDIYYSDLKKYMKKWVESDSNIHKLAQTPTFLEPKGSTSPKFPILRFSGAADSTIDLFTYNQRDAATNISEYWQDFEEVKNDHDWKLENPLLVQRATMLLLQLEKLWYIGLNEERSDLFGDLKDELDALVKTTTTISPIQHSLYDAQAQAPPKKIVALDLSLLTAPVAASPDDESAVATQDKERLNSLKAWGHQFPDWSGGMSVWKAATENQLTQAELKSALAQLTHIQKSIQQAERIGDIEVTNIQWNEIAFLDRIAEDLAWPTSTNDLASFKELIQESISARDHSNKFQAKLIPAFTDLDLTVKFKVLENRRRLLEDRMFAHDQRELTADFRGLVREYEILANQNDKLRTDFETLQRQLIQAPHDYRYCLESLVVQAQNGGDVKTRESVIAQFEKWVKADDGLVAGWSGLRGQMIGALLDSADEQKRITTFQSMRRGGFPVDESADKKGFASNPYRDFEKFDVDIDMSNADGNLYARRLLLWPGLKEVDRQKIRKGLLEKSVSKSGNTDGSEANEGTEIDFDNSEIAKQLAAMFDDESMKGQWLSRWDEPIRFERGNENYFALAAFGSHRLLIERDDETAIQHVIAINDFHSKKSDFVYQRVANDLWGKPTSNGTPFSVAALNNHHHLINDRLKKMPGLEPIKNKVTEVWDSGPKQQWETRANEVKSFCDDFKRWEWQKQTARNSGLADDIEKEKNRDNQFVFAVSPKDFHFDDVIRADFDPESSSLKHQLVTGDSLRVYLRGHETSFEMTRPPVDPKAITYDVNLTADSSYRSELIVQRAAERSDHGHITIVIDCSRSMGKNQMDQAKSDVVQFLEQISSRENISVSLVAIGASRHRKSTGEWDTRPIAELPSWKKVAQQDVWTLKDKDQREIVVRVNSQTLPLLKTAISELQPFGETPILAGLEKAINLENDKDRARLVVLLTDGFEYQNPLKPESKEPFEPFDTTLYRRLDDRFKTDIELVIFNFRDQALPSYFEDIIAAAKKAGFDNFLNNEIIDRTEKIEKLARINKNRYGTGKTSLAKFLKGLLPEPEVIVIGDGEPRLKKVETVRNGIDRNRNGKLSNEELRIMAAIKLGADERPTNWSVGTQIKQTIQNETARSFADQPTPWTSNSRLFGNETLQFDYTPFRLTLTTGSVTGVKLKQIKLGEQSLIIGQTANRLLQPAYEIASQETPVVLTPAPALCYLTLTLNNDSKQSLLLQDFNFGQQQSSNVHPLKFPEIKDDHKRTMFKKKPVDMQIHLVKDFPAQFWSKIEFNDKDPWTLTNEGDKQHKIKRIDYVSVASLLPDAKPFNEYEIEIRRPDSIGDYAEFWIRIQPKNENLPVDRWLVQILNEDGEIDRKINHQSNRKYSYRENADGSRKLISVDHHFTILNRELENSKAYFGFANIDNLEGIKIGKQVYENYFSE